MGIKERLAAIEAKLGIEPPKDGPIIMWDGDNRLGGSFCVSRFDENDNDNTNMWDHFAYLTPEIIAAIKALPEASKD